MGGDWEGNKNMINIPIRIEKPQDHDNQKIGGFTANKVTFAETIEVCFFSRNCKNIYIISKNDAQSHSRSVPILIHEEDNKVYKRKSSTQNSEKVENVIFFMILFLSKTFN